MVAARVLRLPKWRLSRAKAALLPDSERPNYGRVLAALLFGMAGLFVKESRGIADPIIINSIQDLQNISSNLSGDYVLGRDIDASATAAWNNGAGFLPIGEGADGSNLGNFTGTFDGQNHAITGLSIVNTAVFNSPSVLTPHFAGLFLGNAGTIENLRMVSETITGVPHNGASGVGGIVVGNTASGKIDNVSVGGTMTNLATIGGSLGGIAGSNSGQISRSSSNVSINGVSFGTAGVAGGLVGQNSGLVTGSYSTGSISNSVGESAGGLVGVNIGTVTQSYSTVSFSNTRASVGGGLVGDNFGTVSQSF